MKIIKLTPNNQQEVIREAVQALSRGGLLVYPTETVYGLAVDATQQSAVNKLLAYKSRREGKPLSIAVTSQKMAEQFVEINQQASKLYSRFLPGPYTIISKYKKGLADGVASEFNTVGVRIPDHDLVINLVKSLKKPITATSANASGGKRPYAIDDILKNISDEQKKLLTLIIDTGTLPPNEPSTVIDTTLSTPLTVRSRKSDKPNTKDLNAITLTSASEQETKEIAGKLLLKHWNKIKKEGLVVGLSGELGAGKTIFAKGAAQFLVINQTISSPTYTYIKEHDYQRHQTQGKLFHLDMWRVDNEETANRLNIPSLIKTNNLIIVEWWQQAEEYVKKIEPDIVVEFKVLSPNKRSLTISENQPRKQKS